MRKLWIMSLVLLQACGGGGGSDSGSSPSADTPAESDTGSTQDIELVVLRDMQDLSIPDGFSYKAIQTYQLDVSLSGLFSTRSYLSIYSGFTTRSDGTYQADNGSKVTGGPLTSGIIDVSFSLSSSTSEFLIEVWTYDGNPPLQKVFSTTGNRFVWEE
ncbi:hypothetical protein L3V77_21250 [Vibrio sp. DW001]|uniref:hypothetical protein n=1 Tax=Vibrio sp. DW001 TaxID=2912315 RepID=UPI0023B00D85|nr:hypothetical protein [Vibrio sp. DW001]WED28481.1 hypothetical protein L3V77_21250 [Vibrio sp. DW001]